jgi:hypothetical protein
VVIMTGWEKRVLSKYLPITLADSELGRVLLECCGYSERSEQRATGATLRVRLFARRDRMTRVALAKDARNQRLNGLIQFLRQAARIF